MSRHLRPAFPLTKEADHRREPIRQLFTALLSRPLPAATVDKWSQEEISGFLFYLQYLRSAHRLYKLRGRPRLRPLPFS